MSSDNLMSDGKLHFRGGASVVGPSFVTVLCSLNGSSPIGFMVRKVCTWSGDTAPDFRQRDWGKGADWYWGMCLGRLWVPIFELSTWKAIYCTSCILTGRWRQKSGILLLGIQFFFLNSAVLLRSLEFARLIKMNCICYKSNAKYICEVYVKVGTI